MIDFWVAFSEVIIIVRRLMFEKDGVATAGREDLAADHSLLAEALNPQNSLPLSYFVFSVRKSVAMRREERRMKDRFKEASTGG